MFSFLKLCAPFLVLQLHEEQCFFDLYPTCRMIALLLLNARKRFSSGAFLIE